MHEAADVAELLLNRSLLTTVDRFSIEQKEGEEKSAAAVQSGRAAERLLQNVQDQPG